MTSSKKMFLAVSGGLIAVGLVLVALGFVLSGCTSEVFTTSIDMRDGEIVLGGMKVEDPHGLPLIEQLAELGEVHVAAPSAATAPEGPTAPAAPEPPAAPSEPEAPAASVGSEA